MSSHASDSETLDTTGKTIFDDIYSACDPRVYYQQMASLDYCIPEQAKPHFLELFQRCREKSQREKLSVLDIGSSYGVNAVLLKWGLSLEALFKRYEQFGLSPQHFFEVLSLDQHYFKQPPEDKNLHFTGLDISESALEYAHRAGIVENIVSANLEENAPTEQEQKIISQADCIISTGCIGYVSEKTLLEIIDASGEQRPMMAHCILRMFPLKPFEDALVSRGYKLQHLDQLLLQRRFASSEEQQSVIERVEAQGHNTQGYESTGWLYATVLLAEPE